MIKRNKAIFLDRDGVINKKRDDYVKTIDELEIFPNAPILIKELKKNGFLVVVITNQSAINRGFTTDEKVQEIHSTIQKNFKKQNTSIDRFYYCPHRPEEKCNCRKPKTGLFLRAINELNIDPSSSWMIGDHESDIEAGKTIGCKTVKINNQSDFTDAVRKITK